MALPPKVSVASLSPAENEGWMTKEGGSIKSWKRRWFVLKDKKLYYFKTQADTEATGVIELTNQTKVKKEGMYKKHQYSFSVGNPGFRTYFMAPNTDSESDKWVSCLINACGGGKQAEKSAVITTPKPTPAGGHAEVAPVTATYGTGDVRAKLDKAKNAIGFLHEEDSKVLEFWQIWTESIPPPEEVVEGGSIVFQVATSADMEKLNWRASGPQNIFIQKMVDFFWNVGAPETEIDRLNDVGALINPITIGSWIDMSVKGGMDGGWFFPVDVPIKFALEGCDAGLPTEKVQRWAEANGVTRCSTVGRDMGAAPPRQTEIVFALPGETFEEQLSKAMSAYSDFGFPPIVEDALDILRRTSHVGLSLSVITSSEGFVRMGLLSPSPTKEAVAALCELSGAGSAEQIFNFEKCLGVSGPDSVEYQYLMEGFGYGVYKEGFDVVFHYKLS